MRLVILTILLLASPAWGSGDASEILCDSLDADPDYECVCSEPFTGNDPPVSDIAYNPPSSTGKHECRDGGATMSVLNNNGDVNSVPWNSVPSNPLPSGGDGYILHLGNSSGGNKWRVDTDNYEFTNGTYCLRYYNYRTPEYNCASPGTCNLKLPRWDNGGGGNTVGFQTATNLSTGQFYNFYSAYYTSSSFGPGYCDSAADCGFGGNEDHPVKVSRRPTTPAWDNDALHANVWHRVEQCFDHNLTSAQIDDANTEYGTSIIWRNTNHTYARMKITIVSGPNTSYSPMLYGPGVSKCRTGTTCDGRSIPASIFMGSRSRLFSNGTGDPNSYVRGESYLSYVMAGFKKDADATWWLGAAEEVEGELPTPTASPTATATPTPTPTATPGGPTPTATTTPTATPTADPVWFPGDTEAFCPKGLNPDPTILFCDNFDTDDIVDIWSVHNNSGFDRAESVGIGGSWALKAEWAIGVVSAGAISIGLGNLPGEYDNNPTCASSLCENWLNIVQPQETFTEIWTRQYLKFGTGFTVIASPNESSKKFHRFRVLSDHKTAANKVTQCTSSGWPYECCIALGEGIGCVDDTAHPTAYQGHLWPQTNTFPQALFFNSTNGVDPNDGLVLDTGNNCTEVGRSPEECESVFITRVRGEVALWQDYPSGSDWYCIETHVKLNTPGNSDGVEEFYIGVGVNSTAVLEASASDQNMRGSYSGYGINQVVFDNFWNDGSPAANELYRDNIVIGTERIGCALSTRQRNPATEGINFGTGVSISQNKTPYIWRLE